METLRNCPVCSKTQFKPYISCVDYIVSRKTFHIVQCRACGFRFTNPRPVESEIGKYYESDEYISHSARAKGIANKLYKLIRHYTMKKKLGLLNRLTLTPTLSSRTLLDIGCGTGEFLNACKQNGWKVTGIEPSKIARKHAKEKYGIVPLAPEKLLRINRTKFDAITLWHVLEHIHKLEKTIQKMRKLLADHGILIIAVPNCNSFDAQVYGSFWAAWDVPRHLYHFTRKDIEALCGRYGFQLKEVLPMKFDSFYISLLSEKYKNARLREGPGSWNLLAGFLNGVKSNISADDNKRGYSSQMYILKRNT